MMNDDCTASAEFRSTSPTARVVLLICKRASTRACTRKQLEKQASERNRQNLETLKANNVFEGEQTVWAECGVCTPHKHTYFFKIIHKRHLKIPKSGSKYFPKAAPRPPEGKKFTHTCPDQQKINFGRPGPASCTPKEAQIDSLNDTKKNLK